MDGRDILDVSLTSLAWLRRLDCASGLPLPLRTPTSPPRTALAMRYAQRAIVLPTRSTSHDRPPTVKQLEATIRKEYQIGPELDWASSVEPKPPHNYATLIYMAIKSSKTGKVTLSEIYSYIQDNFVYYRDNEGGWKNSIRHNLTQNKFFVRADRKTVAQPTSSKGGFWSLDLDPKFLPDFNRQVRRFGKSKNKGGSRSPKIAAKASRTKGGKGGKGGSARRKSGASARGKPQTANLRITIKNPPSSSGSATPNAEDTAKSHPHENGDLVIAESEAIQQALLEELPDSTNIFVDLYDSGEVNADEFTDRDSESAESAQQASEAGSVGGTEPLLDASPSMWVDESSASSLQVGPTVQSMELSTGLARFGDSVSPRSSLNLDVHALDVDCMLDLVSSFSISEESRMLPTGGDLQVVGVGMSLLAPKDELEVVGVGMTMFPATCAHEAAAGPAEELICFDDRPMPPDWTM
mmetsp:Transcript_34933/g.91442  ORF Transcript_34933/g.91442 Transcript_34933/m.91442 type:complete len:467 (+) Transcript_34933:414-1814(+)